MNPLVTLIVGKLLDWLLLKLGDLYDKLEKKVEARKETSKVVDNAAKHDDTSGIGKP